MRILIANVKLFFQRFVYWVVYLGLLSGFVAAGALGRLGSSPEFSIRHWIPVGVMFVMFIAGLLVGNVREHTASRMVCFMLPGRRVIWRRFTFVCGLILALVGSFVFVKYAKVNGVLNDSLGLGLWAAFAANLTAYLIGTCCAFGRMDFPVGAFVLTQSLVFIGAYAIRHPDSSAHFAQAVLGAPVFMSGVAIVTAVFAWRRLGRERRRGSVCVPKEGRLSDSPVSRFLLSRSHRCQPLAPARYIWGTLHALSLPGNPRWRAVGISLILNAVLVVIVTYGLSVMAFCLVVSPLLLGVAFSGDALFYSKRILAVGREEWFLSIMTALWTSAGVVVLSVVGPIISLDLLQPVLARFEITSKALHYTPVSLWVVVVLGALVPLACLVDIFFLYVPNALAWSNILLVLIGGAALYVVHLWTTPVPLVAIVLLTAVPWMFCAVVVRYVALHTDLVHNLRRQ